MALEIATYINQLNTANPVGSDPIAAGDDHLRLIKSTLHNTFPNITGPITKTQDEINALASQTYVNDAITTAAGNLTFNGRIRQIVASTYTSSVSTGSSSWLPTGHSVTITPSSTASKILLLWSHTIFQTDEYQPSNNAQATLFRNGTVNLAGGSNNLIEASAGYAKSIYVTSGFNLTDSPNATTAQTYAAYLRGVGSQPTAVYTGVAVLTAMEIL